MRWITREQIRVGRIGCSWLIKKFIDPDAEFFFVPGTEVQREAIRLGATGFHANGTELSQHGDVSSFEIVMQHYGLTNDPALSLLGRIVNTADIKSGPYKQPEGYGLKAMTEGLLLIHGNDEAVLEAGSRLYDALYAYCQDMIRRGKPHGNFAE